MPGLIAVRPPLQRPAHPCGRPARILVAVAALLAALAFSTAPIASAVSGVAYPTQSVGDRGTDVLALQRLLRTRLAADAAATGTVAVLPPASSVFDAATATAVKTFQASRGLPVSGIVDTPTWGRLVILLGPGDQGDAVLAIQHELVDKRGAAITIDGTFGPTTRAAILTFQKHMGLTQNGLADGATWRTLVWHYRLPRFGSTRLCDYSVGNGPANWGTAEAIATIEAAGRATVRLGYGRVGVGDVSLEHGGNIPLHATHERGLDADLRPMRRANDQCTWGTRWSYSSYDRVATRVLIKQIRALAPHHIKVIYFNDPVLIREGLTTWYSGHDDHVHVRFCEATHPLATYDC